ncbi:MAG TPA: glycosyltransferase family 2 protein, partial [Myxococcota bacterium]|nr:glycosyltransferase family 2 protein [Myxococcota bacterium]
MATLVSVVMPVYQEREFIALVLEDLLRQQLGLAAGGEAALEVLVVDGGSTDGTQELVRAVAARDPRVRLLLNPRRRSSAGRALGVEAARGEFVAIVDGHCRLPSASWLRDMVELFERTGADCLARPAPLVARDPSYWTDAICAARASRFGHNLTSTLYDGEEHPVDPRSSGIIYRRSVFERVGNFDPDFDACEDVEFNHRVAEGGFLSYRHPDLSVDYRPRTSLRALFRQMFRYGRGRARLMARHPRVLPWPLLL